MNKAVLIKGCGSISPLGASWTESAAGWAQAQTAISLVEIGGTQVPAAVLASEADEEMRGLEREFPRADRATRMAAFAARQAVEQAGWGPSAMERCGVYVGSARGPAESWERLHARNLAGENVPPYASPVTTPGAISATAAQAVGAAGPRMAHAVTCASAGYALGNAFVWLRSGAAPKMLAGGTEAPLTPFTLAQMRALRLYSRDVHRAYPCRPYGYLERDALVLGEGAAVFALESAPREGIRARNALGEFEAFGFGSEAAPSAAGITPDGQCLQRAMRAALAQLPEGAGIDLVLTHAPGTRQGDAAELRALGAVFSDHGRVPPVFSHKWKIGHTLGASSAFGVELALVILNEQFVPDFPYTTYLRQTLPDGRRVKRVLVNAAGFGGNAVSLVIARAD